MFLTVAVRFLLVGVLITIGCLFLAGAGFIGADTEYPAVDPSTIAPIPALSLEISQQERQDNRFRELLPGRWEQQHNGRRVMQVDENGTAVLTYHPEGFVNQSLYGKELQVFFDWSVDDGVITLLSTGGKPETKVKLALSIFGKERQQKIEELTEDRMLLYNPKGSLEPEWKRLSPDAE